MMDKIKISARILTVSILAVLIISGNANAFMLGFSVLNPEVNKGEIINFSISIKNLEQEQIDRIILKIGSINCEFSVNGTIISDCEGMRVNRTGIDYNYGYGAIENLTYSVKLDTSNFSAGIYPTEIQIKYGDKTISQKESDIVVKEIELGSCSVRGMLGNLFAEGIDFGSNNKINFYSPLKNSALGEGYLTGQKDRTRFSYTFDVKKAYRLGSRDVFEVSGKYRIGIGSEKQENAVITLENSKISLISEHINLENMDAWFISRC